MTYSKLTLNLPHTQVAVYIGSAIYDVVFKQLDCQSQRVFIITQQSIYDLYGKSITTALEAYSKAVVTPIFIADGEQAKSIAYFEHCMDQIFEVGVERGDTIIGLGGSGNTTLFFGLYIPIIFNSSSER